MAMRGGQGQAPRVLLAAAIGAERERERKGRGKRAGAGEGRVESVSSHRTDRRNRAGNIDVSDPRRGRG